MRIDKFWMDIFVEFHNASKISLKLLQLSFVCINNFSLLINNFSKFVNFSGVKFDSVLKIRSLLTILFSLSLILIFLLNSFNKFSQVSVFLSNLSNWSLIIKFISIFVIIVLILGLWIALERKMTVFHTWNWWTNYHILDWPPLNSSTICHINWIKFYLNLLLTFYIKFNSNLKFNSKKINNLCQGFYYKPV